MITTLEKIRSTALDDLQKLNDLNKLEAWRINYLGRKGTLTQVLRNLPQLPAEERREAGAAANNLKSLLEKSLASKQESLKKAELLKRMGDAHIDFTRPGPPTGLRRLHPPSQPLR